MNLLLVDHISSIQYNPRPAILYSVKPTAPALPPIAPQSPCNLPSAGDAIVYADTVELITYNTQSAFVFILECGGE